MADVFVSYASEDRDRIEPLVDAVEAAGLSVWWDHRLELGKSFDREIERELDNASCVVVVWSRHSIESDWVRNEAQEGLDRGVLVPVRIDDSRPPLAFRRAQSAVLGEPPEADDLTRLLDAVASCVRGDRDTGALAGVAPPKKQAADDQSKRWPFTAGVTVTAILLLVTAGWWYQRDDLQPSNSEVEAVGAPLTVMAVLPFDDLSPGSDHAWLANGMTAELIEALSRIDALGVRGRTSTALLKARNASIETIGRELNVGSVVVGSVRISGGDLRVTAQLLDVAAGDHVWSGNYDRQLDDVFAIQSEIAQEIAEAIRTETEVEDKYSWEQTARYMPQDVRAYRLMMMGYEALWGGGDQTLTNVNRAIAYYRDAIRMDPGYAEVHAHLGWAYRWQWEHARERESLDKARSEVQQALAIDGNNGSAHSLLGELAKLRWEWPQALESMQRSIELEPWRGDFHITYAEVLISIGEMEESLVHMQRAAELDPFTEQDKPLLALLYWLTGNPDEAIQWFERFPGGLGKQPAMWLQISLAYREKGAEAQALTAAVNGHPARSELDIRRLYEEKGWSGLMQAALEFILREDPRACTQLQSSVHQLYAMLGQANELFECLDVLESGVLMPYGTSELSRNPYRRYHDDPRWQALLVKWNLQPPRS